MTLRNLITMSLKTKTKSDTKTKSEIWQQKVILLMKKVRKAAT